MLPINLNTENFSILLIGQGEKLRAREKKLKELNIEKFTVIEPPFGKIIFRNFKVVLVVGLDEAESHKIYHAAKGEGALVNVEDNKKYCDFFFQSFVKRGDLLISVSTNGKTPGTAKIIRDKIEELFPEIWGSRIDEIAAKRDEWKTSGKDYDEVNNLTKQYIKDKNWL